MQSPDPILTSALAVRDRLAAMCKAAWGLPGSMISGRGFDETERGPVGMIALTNIPSEFDGARSVVETYDFLLGLRRPLEAGTDIDRTRIEKGQAFGALFLSEPWSDIGAYQPRVPVVEAPPADLADGFFDLYINVTLLSDRFQ